MICIVCMCCGAFHSAETILFYAAEITFYPPVKINGFFNLNALVLQCESLI